MLLHIFPNGTTSSRIKKAIYVELFVGVMLYLFKKVNKENVHHEVNKADVETFKSELERDVAISQAFVDKFSQRGDEIHYKMEKNEDSHFSIQKKTADCQHIECLEFDEKGNNTADNSQKLKEIIYSDRLLTDEEAQLFSKIATAGMLNLKPKDKVSSAILYDKDLSSIDETAVILNRGSAGVINEFLFTAFERFRAWANKPAILGASNATRDHAQIAKKIDEYNAYHKSDEKNVALHNVAHSLGVSGNKNMLNWSEYMKQEYKNTDIDFLHLGGSYPSEEIHKQASHLFRDAKTKYHGVKGDSVYSGLGGLFIGNNPNAEKIEGLGFGKAHSEANQNINNLKYIYNPSNEKDVLNKIRTEEILRRMHPNSNGNREFHTYGE